MVNESGQLYTIEGVAAALIMVMTAYLVVNATSVYTAGDTHISDMQLETMGTDALTVMDMPVNSTDIPFNTSLRSSNSTLRSILRDSYSSGQRNDTFKTQFLKLVNAGGTLPEKSVQFIANYTCVDNSQPPELAVVSTTFSNSTHPFTGSEHSVRVTKWVVINKGCPDASDNRARAALVEVLMWID